MNNGPFMSVSDLQERPGHIAVFLHYLICNSDPSAYLFYLVTENYSTGTIKEMRKWAYEIHSTFTSKQSVCISISNYIIHYPNINYYYYRK